MTYAELCERLARNEHEQALHAVERVRYHMLEGRLARAEATAERERRLRHEHTLDENDALTRLRAEIVRLRSENDMLRRALSVMPAEAPPPARSQPSPRLSAAARAIMQRPPPDPAGFDRTIRRGSE
jgi:hypothetical protein